MPTFLLEVYAPQGTDMSELVAQARSAEGLHHLRSIFVPEDEICFHLFSASHRPPNDGIGRFVEVVEEPAISFEPRRRATTEL